jgi:hypothetical protein
VCIIASVLMAYLIAGHLSSTSSPSSLTAIGLGGLGVLLILVGGLLFIGGGLERLWRRARSPSGGFPRRSERLTQGGPRRSHVGHDRAPRPSHDQDLPIREACR